MLLSEIIEHSHVFSILNSQKPKPARFKRTQAQYRAPERKNWSARAPRRVRTRDHDPKFY